jgi:protoheme IX farnesyltransferase
MMDTLKSYLGLTKHYAVAMIVFVSGVSYSISPESGFSWLILFHLCLGIGVAGSGALALNQYLERDTDRQMDRTKNRPLARGDIDAEKAHFYSHVLMWGGYLYLAYMVNTLCAIATFICGMSYLYLYTPMKKNSSLSTFSGSIPGAMLPIMGWLGKYNNFFEFDAIEPSIIIMLLAMILFLWQIPHSLIIAIRYKEDYQKVGMQQLPLVSGNETAYRHIYLNLILLLVLSIIPFFCAIFPNITYLILVVLLNFWLIRSFQKYKKENTKENLIIFYRHLMMYLPFLLSIIIIYNELSRWSFHWENWF